jgi:hypothetical protein
MPSEALPAFANRNLVALTGRGPFRGQAQLFADPVSTQLPGPVRVWRQVWDA